MVVLNETITRRFIMNDSIEISADIFDVYPLTVEEYENADVIMDNVEVE
jgi:hypothetical protein